MISEDADADLRKLADDATFAHADAARLALRFRATGDVASLVAVADDPHPCAMIEVLVFLAGWKRPWLNWVPMPSEAVCEMADHIGRQRAEGDTITMTRTALTAPEPASAMMAFQRVVGGTPIDYVGFPQPDIRVPLHRGKYAIWRYDGRRPVASAPAPSAQAVELLHETAEEAWPSPLAGYAAARRLGELPLPDLLGLLAHLPSPPDTPRWRHLATVSPTYWYRMMQPWVCLAILRHQEDEPWTDSIRRQVLVDLALGVEDWAADSALFALVTAAFRDPAVREEVHGLVRARLDATVEASKSRVVTIAASVAHLMLVTPGCRAGDRRLAQRVLARSGGGAKPGWRRWLPWP
ncbi:hypothetical protein AB0M47_07705 [Hamadaea sp. NPDC051192]|uniref:hypothetical protein n=1 Tax=Hamadaea sp. NPDC051192 TaxID=3154940 RepID=UPI0034215C83